MPTPNKLIKYSSTSRYLSSALTLLKRPWMISKLNWRIESNIRNCIQSSNRKLAKTSFIGLSSRYSCLIRNYRICPISFQVKNQLKRHSKISTKIWETFTNCFWHLSQTCPLAMMIQPSQPRRCCKIVLAAPSPFRRWAGTEPTTWVGMPCQRGMRVSGSSKVVWDSPKCSTRLNWASMKR